MEESEKEGITKEKFLQLLEELKNKVSDIIITETEDSSFIFYGWLILDKSLIEIGGDYVAAKINLLSNTGNEDELMTKLALNIRDDAFLSEVFLAKFFDKLYTLMKEKEPEANLKIDSKESKVIYIPNKNDVLN